MIYPPYSKAVDWLNENDPFFATLLVTLGSPVVCAADDPEIQTAAVRLSPGGNSVELCMNEGFFENLSDAECAAVLSHETYHVVLDHLKNTSADFPDTNALRLAEECIINDILTNRLFVLPGNPCYGPELVGVDCSTMSLRAVYDLFVAKSENSDSDDKDEDSDGDGSGTPCSGHGSLSDEDKEALADAISDLLSDALNKSVENGSADQAPSELKDQAAADEDLPSLDSGSVSKNAGQSFSEAELLAQKNPSALEWVELLTQVNPDISKKKGSLLVKTKTNWGAPRRRTQHLASQGIYLPSSAPLRNKGLDKESNKKSLVVALDFSGSIPRHLAQKMAEFARMVPENLIEIECCTFSTEYVPFDHKKDRNRVASGGTDFSAVESFVKSTMKPGDDYPHVVVITDGCASFWGKKPSTEQLASKWFWVPTSSQYASYMRGLNFCKQIVSLNLSK